MGNVSHKVPSIHPVYSIGPAINHTREFTKLSGKIILICKKHFSFFFSFLLLCFLWVYPNYLATKLKHRMPN